MASATTEAAAPSDAVGGAELLAALDPGGYPGGEEPLADHVGDEGANEDARHHQLMPTLKPR